MPGRDAPRPRRRARRQRPALSVRLHHHRVRRHQRVPRASSASGTTPKMISKEGDCRSDRLRRHAPRGARGNHRAHRRLASCLPGGLRRHQHRSAVIALVASSHDARRGVWLGPRIRAPRASIGPLLTVPRTGDLLGLRPGESLRAELAEARLPEGVAGPRALQLERSHGLGYSVDPYGLPTPPRSTDSGLRAPRASTSQTCPRSRATAGEVVAARTGGGVSLAVGMARVCSAGCRG
jgi:hypothetical protein